MRRGEGGRRPATPRGWAGLAIAVALLVGLAACGGGEGEPAGGAGPGPAGEQEAPRMADLLPVSPGDEVSLADGFSFAWALPEGASGGTWRIVVFAGGQDPIWESPRMTFTEFEAPAALILKLEPDRAYTWRVRGNLNGGGRATTPDSRFVTR